MEFLEAPLFSQLLPGFLTDEAYRELQQYLAREPEAGDIIPGTGGFRKLRWADTRRGRERASDSQIWLMTVYDKDSAIDLTPAEKRTLKAAIEEETRERAHRKAGRRT